MQPVFGERPQQLRMLAKISAVLSLVFATSTALGETFPQLPKITFDYSFALPLHLRSVPQSTASVTRLNQVRDKTRHNNLATLGRVLFYDTSLSANNLVSCGSCHKQIHGFDDPTPFSIGFKGLITKRNTMGLTNARFNTNGRYFWDERAIGLMQQTLQAFFDPIEMGLKEGQLISKVLEKNYYPQLFKRSFTNTEVTQDKIAMALAAFVSSITSTNAPYDIERAKVDNSLARFSGFTDQENRGKYLFFTPPRSGGAGCSSCHQTDAFISPANGANNGIDANTGRDQGIGGVSQTPSMRGNFRTPSLRNIGVRAPFMHDGRFTSLDEVINHYSNGIMSHPNLGETLKDLEGKPRKFNFSQQDKDALIAFLETLSDVKILTDPKYSNPFN